MDLLKMKRQACGTHRLYKGGSTSTESNPITTNTDNRQALQDAIGISGDGSSIATSTNTDYSLIYSDNSNSSDAILALTNAGADIIKNSGAAVVDLAKFQGAQNTAAWDKTLTTGADLVDKLIDKTSEGFALSSKVIDSFTPTESKNADIGKYAMIAAAVVAGAVLLKGAK